MFVPFIKRMRPISPLPIFGKMFGKIICDRIYNNLKDNGIVSLCQSGY